MERDKDVIGLSAESQRYLKELEERDWFKEGQELARFALAYAVRANTPAGNASQVETRWASGNFDKTGEIRAVLGALYPDCKTPVRLMEHLVNVGLRLLHSGVTREGKGPAELLTAPVGVQRTQETSDPEASSASGRDLRLVSADEVQPFVNAVPLLELKIAAGGFSTDQLLASANDFEWVAPEGRTRPGPGLFVAQVVGESMNRRIPNGAWCLWRANPTGTRQGKVVLAQHGDINDPELGGRYTVKVYESEKVATDDGGWRHSVVRLKPDSDDPSFEPIEFENLEEGDLAIVAELVEVLA